MASMWCPTGDLFHGGRAWLGWDSATGQPMSQPEVDGLPDAAEVLTAPRANTGSTARSSRHFPGARHRCRGAGQGPGRVLRPATCRSPSRPLPCGGLAGFIGAGPGGARRGAGRSGRRHGRGARAVPRGPVRGRAGRAPQARPDRPAGGAAAPLGLPLRDGGVPVSPDPHRRIGQRASCRRRARATTSPAFRSGSRWRSQPLPDGRGSGRHVPPDPPLHR
jgi:hypothetical protein